MGIKKKPYGSKSITTNGTHDVAWKKEAVVNVAGGVTTQEKTVTENGLVTPDAGYDALSQVNVNVPQLDTSDATANAGQIVVGRTAYVNGQKITGSLGTVAGTILQNGTFYSPSGTMWYKMIVNVQPNTEERTFTENGTYSPSAGMDGMHSVTVNVPQLDTSDATAHAYDIRGGYTAYVNGVKVTGTMTVQHKTITENGVYDEAGYYDRVTVNVPQYDSSSATATASDIALGKTAWVNNVEVTGTMAAPEVVTGTYSMTAYNKDMTIPALIGKTNVILYQTGADINSGSIQLFKCVNGTVDTYYYTTSSSKIVANRIGGTFTSSTGKVSTGTTDHRFGITTYTYIAW